MTVIIPHPTEEFFFIKLQKEIIKNIFSNDFIVYRHIPLFIELPETDINYIKQNIKEVLILNPEYSEKENSIFLKALIKIENKTIESKLKLIDFIYEKNKQKKEINQIDLSLFKINKKLTVFRIGNASKSDKNCFKLENFVWKKL